MLKLPRVLPLMLITAALAIPVSASAGSSNGRSDRRGGQRQDTSETRRSDDRNPSTIEDRHRSDSSGDSSATHSRSSGRQSYESSHRGSSRHSSSRHSSSHSGSIYRTTRHYRGHSDHHRVVVHTAPQVVYVQPPRVIVRHDRYYEPMYLGDEALAAVLYDLDRATFSSDKMSIIRHVAGSYTMSVHAAKRMVSRLTFSNDRVQALEVLYPRVQDKQNWYRVYDLLTFSSDRDQLRSRCGGH